MDVIIGNYYILKNSEDITDVIKVIRTWGDDKHKFPVLIDYEYFIQNDHKQKNQIHFKQFKAIYKEHETLNILYGPKVLYGPKT